ncbi:MAG: hypothetical protein NZ890_12600 [Myxococcota bacterium]|nr:hypothetical protein [Myxococcota bacterium]
MGLRRCTALGVLGLMGCSLIIGDLELPPDQSGDLAPDGPADQRPAPPADLLSVPDGAPADLVGRDLGERLDLQGQGGHNGEWRDRGHVLSFGPAGGPGGNRPSVVARTTLAVASAAAGRIPHPARQPLATGRHRAASR